MTAFPNSGHSNVEKLINLTGRNRPEAVTRLLVLTSPAAPLARYIVSLGRFWQFRVGSLVVCRPPVKP